MNNHVWFTKADEEYINRIKNLPEEILGAPNIKWCCVANIKPSRKDGNKHIYHKLDIINAAQNQYTTCVAWINAMDKHQFLSSKTPPAMFVKHYKEMWCELCGINVRKDHASKTFGCCNPPITRWVLTASPKSSMPFSWCILCHKSMHSNNIKDHIKNCHYGYKDGVVCFQQEFFIPRLKIGHDGLRKCKEIALKSDQHLREWDSIWNSAKVIQNKQPIEVINILKCTWNTEVCAILDTSSSTRISIRKNNDNNKIILESRGHESNRVLLAWKRDSVAQTMMQLLPHKI
jgi:hypothetical protein